MSIVPAVTAPTASIDTTPADGSAYVRRATFVDAVHDSTTDFPITVPSGRIYLDDTLIPAATDIHYGRHNGYAIQCGRLPSQEDTAPATVWLRVRKDDVVIGEDRRVAVCGANCLTLPFDRWLWVGSRDSAVATLAWVPVLVAEVVITRGGSALDPEPEKA